MIENLHKIYLTGACTTLGSFIFGMGLALAESIAKLVPSPLIDF